MKHLRLILASLITLFVVGSISAQEPSNDFFTGKWELLFPGTPRGDYKMQLTVVREGDELKAVMTAEGEDPVESTRVDEKKGKSITIHYTNNSGFEVYLFIEKNGDDAIKGSMMNMFNATGKRIKE